MYGIEYICSLFLEYCMSFPLYVLNTIFSLFFVVTFCKSQISQNCCLWLTLLSLVYSCLLLFNDAPSKMFIHKKSVILFSVLYRFCVISFMSINTIIQTTTKILTNTKRNPKTTVTRHRRWNHKWNKWYQK